MLGEEVIIAKGNQPLVKIVPLASVEGKRKPGSGQGQLLFMADDFDATLDDFKVANDSGAREKMAQVGPEYATVRELSVLILIMTPKKHLNT